MKIQELLNGSSVRFLKVTDFLVKSTYKESLKPVLRLRGDYLKRAGLEIGCRVKVQIFKDRIIIEKHDDEKDDTREAKRA